MKKLMLLILLFWVNVCLGTEPLKFMWFSDTHNCDRDTIYGRYYRQVLTDKLPTMITIANSVGASLVIGTGDIAEFEHDKTGTLANLAAVTGALAAAGLEYKFAVGNHDIPYATKPLWLAQLGYSKGYYSFDRSGVHFVFLDANFDDAGNDHAGWTNDRPYYIPQAEQDWLTADLAVNKNKPTLVFTHQRIDSYSYSGSGAHGTVEASAGNAVRSILESAGNVKVVFQGHVHTSTYSVINGIKYYSIMSMVDGNAVTNANNNAYALVDINADGDLTITPYALADITSAWTNKTTKTGTDNYAEKIKITVPASSITTNLGKTGGTP
ncbi:MAG: metallophosphoesterase [Kiritimatiellia bacterium]|nr:metallophosphoesterase [Kiritimatiellia bacterium]